MKNLTELIKEKNFNEIIKSEKVNFQVAYSHYRLFNYKKSLKILHKLQMSKRVKILMAQNYFYLQDFKRAYALFSSFSDDEYVQFNMNCAIYLSKNKNTLLPEKYSIYGDEVKEMPRQMKWSILLMEDAYNSSFCHLNNQMAFNEYLRKHQSNKLIFNQLMNLEGNFSAINTDLLTKTDKLIFQRNQGEKILLPNRRLFQNNYTFRKFCRRKNLLKLNSMDFTLGAYLDLRDGKKESKNLKKVNSLFYEILEPLFSENESKYKEVYDKIITNL